MIYFQILLKAIANHPLRLYIPGPLIAAIFLSFIFIFLPDINTRDILLKALWRGIFWWYVGLAAMFLSIIPLTMILLYGYLFVEYIKSYFKRDDQTINRELLAFFETTIEKMEVGKSCEKEFLFLAEASGMKEKSDIEGIFESGFSAEELSRIFYNIDMSNRNF